MKQSDRGKLEAYYGEKLGTYGNDTRSLGWTPGGRKVRFGVLASVGDMAGCSLLDAGCGFGDFYGYLQERGIQADYTGVDINAEFISIAREKHPEARFEISDFEEQGTDEVYDWAFAVGIFTIRLSDNETFVKNTLRRMFDCCRKGFAADFLRPTYGDAAGDVYWRPQPEKIAEICRGLSKRFVIRCDYMADEFCVYVYKNDMADERNVFEEYEKR
jgi:Trans-aconitate methyltransferase